MKLFRYVENLWLTICLITSLFYYLLYSPLYVHVEVKDIGMQVETQHGSTLRSHHRPLVR